MDRETKKNILASFVALRHEVESMEDRLRRLESEAVLPPMRPGSGSQHTKGSGDRNERAYIRWLEYKDRVQPQIEAGRCKMRAIQIAIQTLTDPLERDVLEQRYTAGETIRLPKWREVALQMYGDDDERDLQAVYRLHNEALDHIDLEIFNDQKEGEFST